MKNLALIGFMASGKSTLGRILAHEMNYKFVDTDKVAETTDGRKISKIFDTDGEDFFRTLETQVLSKCAASDKVVLSTGGGIIERAENIEILKKNCFVVFLDIPFDILFGRASATNTRPLFKDPEKAFTLWKKRYDMYRNCADMVYNGHNEILLKSARKIMTEYYKYNKKHG